MIIRKDRNKFWFVYFIISIFLISCDHEHIKDYYVINIFNDSITLTYKEFSKDVKNDSILLNDTLLIYSEVYDFGSYGVEDNRNEMAITNVSIEFRNNKKIFDQNIWIYKELGKYHAEYYFTVDSSLFKDEK